MPGQAATTTKRTPPQPALNNMQNRHYFHALFYLLVQNNLLPFSPYRELF